LAFIEESSGDFISAREDYQAAIVEDLSYGAAHLRLGLMALQQGDTTLALTELDRAVSVNDADFAALLTAGYAYAAVPQYAEAAKYLERAAALEPYAAPVQLLTAQVLEASGDHAGAMRLYRHFLAVAPVASAGRPQAERRLAALEAAKPE
jgi:type IV pilus assembly protein PilF